MPRCVSLQIENRLPLKRMCRRSSLIEVTLQRRGWLRRWRAVERRATWKTDNLSEGDSSSSEASGASTEESSDEEDEENDDEQETSEGGAEDDEKGEDDKEVTKEGHKNGNSGSEGAGAEPHAAAVNGRDERLKLCCEKCKSVHQTHGTELVTPQRRSKGRFQLALEGEGTYECSVTGLVFQASEPVLVRYSILSWSKFGSFLPNSWKFAGPIFNVDTVNKDASVLTSIQFPHSICLANPEEDLTFSVLHVKDNRPLIEPTADHSGSHVKWNVTSLSPVGPIIQKSGSVEHHGVVLVYKQLGSDANNYSFHVYLATNSSSDIKDIGKQVRGYKNRYMKIDKPPTCKLDEGTYRLVSEPEGEIKPEELKFTLAVTKMKGYFEAFFEERPPFKLSLIEINTDETVWSATIREGDCVDNSEKKPRKRTISGRQGSSSHSEEETACKRPKWQDESDGVKAGKTQGQDLSEKQLLKIARQLGKEWKEVAIFLGIESKYVDDLQVAENCVSMQKLKMLLEWKKRQSGKATACHLLYSLNDLDSLSVEVRKVLKGMTKEYTHSCLFSPFLT
ncbi:uncharacterized protein LOC114133582 isoform X3 [Xiphophorus couchianus]|uniref:uncharacterized protein LOC114133582 isoform X3 n=1 Tax=Xiphophorus couchianus TaxID=32473 RepID=UPI001016852A|nr:uncharacterized protein LOC114133582 isoform X3 [Xiphophorus couchianus]